MKIAILSLLFWIMLLPVITYAENHYIKDSKSGCLIQVDQSTEANWSGDCVEGKASGQGTASYSKNGVLIAIYKGELKAGERNGIGEYKYENGEWKVTYKGEFNKGELNATCEITTYYNGKLSILYKGKCENMEMNGYGDYTKYSNYDGSFNYQYKGQFKHDKKNGEGKYFSGTRDHLTYEGTWKDDCIIFGKHIGDSGSYEGEMDCPHKHGQGTFIWPNGDRYVGAWENDVRSGFGKMTRVDGSIIHEGEWKIVYEGNHYHSEPVLTAAEEKAHESALKAKQEREARENSMRVCKAQKQTCFATCEGYNEYNNYSCRQKCKEISCD